MLQSDIRLNAWHMALLLAIFYLQSTQGCCNRIRVSRKKLMSLSHIRTLPSYHKYLEDLQDFGYISYHPSYHPSGKSEIMMSPALQNAKGNV